LPAAHERCAAADKLEAGGAGVDMRCLLYRTDEMYNDHPEATLARANMHDLLHQAGLPSAYTTMAADDELATVLAALPEADSAMANDDKLEAALGATALPQALEAADMNDEHRPALADSTRQVSECSTTVPGGFARQVSEEQEHAWVSKCSTTPSDDFSQQVSVPVNPFMQIAIAVAALI